MNVLIGHRAGEDMTNQLGVVIIGDGIKFIDLRDKTKEDVLFVGDNVAIGKYVFGLYNTLYDILK